VRQLQLLVFMYKQNIWSRRIINDMLLLTWIEINILNLFYCCVLDCPLLRQIQAHNSIF
jgi:hypothetical protein